MTANTTKIFRLPLFLTFMIIAPPYDIWAQDVPPGGSLDLFVYVYDQYGRPMPGVQVNWTITFKTTYSGYHYHTQTGRPKGTMDVKNGGYTDANGRNDATFHAPDVASDLQIVARHDPYGPEDYMLVAVIVSDLQELSGGNFSLEGWTAAHPYNHWGTSDTTYMLSVIASNFYSQTGCSPIGINDMSLPWGGRFDIGPSYECSQGWWLPCHVSHMYGRNADIRKSSLCGQITTFSQIVSSFGCTLLDEGSHFHFTDRW